ncbi:MAG TPA: NAD-dependent epimerase/dehydratase family protein [Acidimicrobiales bacterium]|nr:NAD-dependent epimerase/dehydratase family protein [Acidimicrobiales bacterium]
MAADVRVGVTGAHGLVGWHLRCRLFALAGCTPVAAGRPELATPEAMAGFVRDCDVIVHCAGMNRGADDDVERTNVELAQRLVDALEATGLTPQVVYANSVQRTRDTPYGRSKRRAAEILGAWAERAPAPFVDLVLPHVFGEDGRPFYNSVVSTFCHQVAKGEAPVVENDAQLELAHAQDVAEAVTDLIGRRASGEERVSGRPMTVRGLLAAVEALAAQYRDHRIPDLGDPFQRALFSTLRSYLFPAHYPAGLTLRSDERGTLFEAVRTDNRGQTFMSTTRPGFTRGQHFHLRKFERFLVVEGEAVIRIRRMFSDEVHSFEVSGTAKGYVDMPSLYTHSITNTGSSDLLTLFWTDEIFDPAAPDTIPEPV